MQSFGLILCSLGVVLATYPPHVPSISMGGSRGGMSRSFMSSVQPGFNTQGFTGMQQPSYMLGTAMNSQPFSNSMNGRFMSAGSSSGPSFIGTVVPTSTGEVGVLPRTTRITTRYTLLSPGVGTGSFTGGMSGPFSSAPYMSRSMSGIAGGSPYMSRGMSGIAGGSPYMSTGMSGFTGGSPYMSRSMTGITGGSPYMSTGMSGIAGGSPYMSRGISGFTGGSPYISGGMGTSQGFPMSNSFNFNGVGGPSSMTYRSFGQSGGSSFYPYSTGMSTGMGSFPQMSSGSFNSFGGPTSFGRGSAVGFRPAMYHKKRGSY